MRVCASRVRIHGRAIRLQFLGRKSFSRIYAKLIDCGWMSRSKQAKLFTVGLMPSRRFGAVPLILMRLRDRTRFVANPSGRAPSLPRRETGPRTDLEKFRFRSRSG